MIAETMKAMLGVAILHMEGVFEANIRTTETQQEV